MYDIKIKWNEFKAVVSAKSLSVSYLNADGNYFLFTTSGDFQLLCTVMLSSSEAVDFEDNYKNLANNILA